MNAYLVAEKANSTLKSVRMFNTQTFAKLFVDEAYKETLKKASKEEQAKAEQYEDKPYFKIIGTDGTVYQMMAYPISVHDERKDINPATEDRKVFLVYADTDDNFYARATADPDKVPQYKKEIEDEGVTPSVKEEVLIDLTVSF